MKVAIFMRGPFRPDLESGLVRARALAQEVRDHGGEPTLFFATWMLEDRAALATLVAQPDVGNVLAVEPPSDEMIYRICGITELPNGKDVRNVFYQYFLSRVGLEVVDRTGKFDFVVHSRPDLDIRFGEHFDEWFTEGFYTTIHFGSREGLGFTNDQIGVATPENMYSFWNYGTLENLGEMIRQAGIPENVLDKMYLNSGVQPKAGVCEVWRLDERRFL
ncbi:MAG: hypothetical protein GX458_23455 [Phyllobacteriaceae bacterium]|nr:hypothetical protein [Phyllobacteriaceae bacterium]